MLLKLCVNGVSHFCAHVPYGAFDQVEVAFYGLLAYGFYPFAFFHSVYFLVGSEFDVEPVDIFDELFGLFPSYVAWKIPPHLFRQGQFAVRPRSCAGKPRRYVAGIASHTLSCPSFGACALSYWIPFFKHEYLAGIIQLFQFKRRENARRSGSDYNIIPFFHDPYPSPSIFAYTLSYQNQRLK